MDDCIEQLRAAVGVLDRAADDVADAEGLVASLVPIERQLTAIRTRAAARATAQGAAQRCGDKDPATWLARQTGTSKAQAGRALDTQKRLDALPVVREAIEQGQLSADQADAISRAAESNPSEQARLVDLAGREPLTELRRECDRVIATSDSDFDARQARIHRDRSIRTVRRADGSKALTAVGTNADISVLEQRLRRATRHVQKQHRAAGDRDSGIEAVLFDALLWLTAPQSVEASPTAPCGCREKPRIVHRSIRELLIHLSWSAALRGRVLPGELCEIDGDGPIPLVDALDLADDPFIKAVLRDGTDIKRVLHFGRNVPAELVTALEAQGRRCAVPGCTNRAWLEIDHAVVNYAAGGPLALWNTQFLCTHHHRQKTAGKLPPLPPPPAASTAPLRGEARPAPVRRE
ncbi:MAG: HNH endonuclease signature motif containing protein [Acidimicrobiales bacterium]